MANTLSHGTRNEFWAAAAAVTPNTSSSSGALKIPPNAAGTVVFALNVAVSGGTIDPAEDFITLTGYMTDDASDAGFPITDDVSSLTAYNLLANSTGASSCNRGLVMKWAPVIKATIVSTGAKTFTFTDAFTVVSQVR